MDHHCPWVNNCIGFWNRKYFILLLFYVQISTIFVFGALIPDLIKSGVYLYEAVTDIHNIHIKEVIFALEVIIVFLFASLICTLMFMFFNFHRKLVRENKTTIENLEHKNKEYRSNYEMSEEENIVQVMGTIKWLWPFPIMPNCAKPKGEGIYFHKNHDSEGSEGEGEDEENKNQGNERPPANFGAAQDSSQNQNSQVVPTANILRTSNQINQGGQPVQAALNNPNTVRTADQMDKPETAKQGDKMIIHNEKASQWQNLNNIVHSDNPVQVYKSSESEKEASYRAPVQNKRQFTNSSNDYERKVQDTTQEPMKRLEDSKLKPPGKNLAQDTRGTSSGRPGGYASPGQKVQKKRGTINSSKPGKVTASDRYKAGLR